MKKGNKSKVQEERKQQTSSGGGPSFHLVQPEIHKKKERENLGNEEFFIF